MALSSSVKRTVLAILILVWFMGRSAMAQDIGSIQGNVADSSGAPILGAVVAVEGMDGNRHTTVTDIEGSFKISSLSPGNYNIKISAAGLSDWSALNVPVSVAPGSKPLLAVLQVAPEITTVTVSPPQEEVERNNCTRN